MAAAQIDLAIDQGSTWNQEIQWLQPDGITPVDLSGCTARSQWRASIADTTVLEELTTENGKIVIDTTLGKITFHLSALQTAAITYTSAVYDLEIVWPVNLAGEVVVERIAKGKVKISLEITR
jgi:hypothetical protein